MQLSGLKRPLFIGLTLVLLWAGCKYILPVVLPFLLGGLVALAAEPAVCFGQKRLKMSRGLSAGIGVSVTLVLLAGIIFLLGAVTVKELGNLAGAVPDLSTGAAVLEDWLISVADRAPDGIRPLAQRTVLDFFDSGSAMMQQLTSRIPAALPGILSGLGNSVLGVGTGILAAFLISARLPELRRKLQERLPKSWHEKYLPALKRVKTGIWGWLKAQGKLSLVTWGIVSAGFVVLQIPYGILWAALVAVVDAVPILGTGTVLVPYALVSYLQGNGLQAVGLLCTYAAAVITRTVLEPRLVGRQLGLDPLLTLLSLYVGYRFWGIPGLLFTPILASMVKSLLTAKEMRN